MWGRERGEGAGEFAEEEEQLGLAGELWWQEGQSWEEGPVRRRRRVWKGTEAGENLEKVLSGLMPGGPIIQDTWERGQEQGVV